MVASIDIVLHLRYAWVSSSVQSDTASLLGKKGELRRDGSIDTQSPSIDTLVSILASVLTLILT